MHDDLSQRSPSEKEDMKLEVLELIKETLWFPTGGNMKKVLDAEDWYQTDRAIRDIPFRFRVCGLGSRHLKRINNTFKPWQSAFDRACRAVDCGAVFALIGGKGSGKTQLAAMLLRRSIERLEAVRSASNNTFLFAQYRTWGDIAREVKTTFSDKHDQTEKDIIDHLTAVPLLVVDEIHEGRSTDFEAALFVSIVDARYRSEKSTILISNQKKQAFSTHVGLSVSDRMREGGGIIECDWESFRAL